ncbi:MAG: class I SAM-dependent methyltransferase [Acidobacteriota bacterium]|nr:class I SAM-dependent methyltransferase [Acidobacteriota bacterium]MDQ4123039.1 class I SAM-dependent methyltransferase [Acidobacteriota bacterium]
MEKAEKLFEGVADAEVLKDRTLGKALRLEQTRCCLCETEDAEPIGVGEDFEYRTSDDVFLAMRCRACGLVYLNPRPAPEEFQTIYPSNYHAFEFSPDQFGFVYRVRRRLEARRLLNWCSRLPATARILDVGCGDGFHLDVLKEFGKKSWQLEGIDTDERAVRAGEQKGLKIHCGTLETADLPANAYDLVLLIQTIEHVASPPELLRQIRRVLKPGGKLVIITDNTDSPDFRIFKGRYWGGYHFPRHWNLFNPKTMRALAEKCEFEPEKIVTVVSPVNWTYSIRNLLDDAGAPRFVVDFFSLKSAPALAAFTIFDTTLQFLGRGALLNAHLRKPL